MAVQRSGVPRLHRLGHQRVRVGPSASADEVTLQYPVYESSVAWSRNEYRLKHLAPHHRQMLLHMQPFKSDLDANYLGVINRLARIDRHRRLTISTAYLAEMEPVIQVPAGSLTSLEWGQRVLIDGHAQVARISVTPWTDGFEIVVNPRIGVDPEVAEWADSAFWGRMPFTERLKLIQIFLGAEIAVYEYDCTGASRKADALTASYRKECDQRDPLAPICPRAPVEVAWVPRALGERVPSRGFGGRLPVRGGVTRPPNPPARSPTDKTDHERR